LIKLADTLKAMSDFPVALADSIYFDDDSSLQEKFDNKELGGGDSSVTLTQEDYEALSEEEKLNGLYYTYDTKRIYKNGVQYGASEPIPLTMKEFKILKEAGALDAKQDYLVEADAEGILLGAEDIGYNNAESGLEATTVQGAVDKVAEKVDGLINDTDLTSTTSTLSANKIKNAVTYSFNTQDGSVKYVKFKPSVTAISVADIYGGKIEILGASKSVSNPDYKTVKVVRLSYGDWSSYDATQVPSVVHTKIGELYYYPTDEYYYLKFYNYASFTMTGLATAPELVTSLPAEESAMTLIPESKYASINDSSTSENSTWSSSKIANEITSTYLTKDVAAGGDNKKTVSFKVRKDYFSQYYAKRTFLLSANIYSLGFSKPVIGLVEIYRNTTDSYDGYVVNLQDTRFIGATVTVNGDYLEVVVTFNSYESSGAMISCSSLSNVPIV